MERAMGIKTCGSTVTTMTHDTVNTGDRTVRHYNGREIGAAKDRGGAHRPSSKGRSEISLYSDDLSHTMRSCIGKIDEEHKREKAKPRERARGNSLTSRGSGWSNFFTCCGDSTDLSTIAPPDVREIAVTDDESESVSSAGSLGAILDESCDAEDAMLLETAKRDTLDIDTLRRKKRWRGHLKASSSTDKALQDKNTSSPLIKSSSNDITSLFVGEQWRVNLKRSMSAGERTPASSMKLPNAHPPPSPKRSLAKDNSNLVIGRLSRSQSVSESVGLNHALTSPRDITSLDVEERWRSHQLKKGESADGQSPASSMKSRTKERHSKSGNRDFSAGCPPLSPIGSPPLSPIGSPAGDIISLVMGRRSRSHSKSRHGATGHALPPPSPNKTALDEIAGLDMLVELQKGEAQIEKKLSHEDKRGDKKGDKKGDKRGTFRRARRRPLRKVMGVKSDRSIFSFPDTSPVRKGLKTKVVKSEHSHPGIKGHEIKVQDKKEHIYGLPCGSYENISTGGPYGTEVNNTYSSFRMDPQIAEKVMSRLTFSLPLYHTLPPNASTKTLKHVCSEPIASDFRVRGPTYMVDSDKIPSRESMFSILGANNVFRRKTEPRGASNGSRDFLIKFRAACEQTTFQPPFILIFNFIVPWGNFSSYFYRPNGTDGSPFSESESEEPSEKLWREFLQGDETFRNNTLKLIPSITVGPWVLKKMVGPKPGMIGQKLPVTYSGSLEDGYLEICMDITGGGKVANTICTACSSKASMIAVDLAFLLQGDNIEELPEQLLGVMRLHHIQLKEKNLV